MVRIMASVKKVPAEAVAVAIEQLLKKYGRDVQHKATEQAEKLGKEAVKKLKATAPVGATGKYARDWAIKKYGDGFTIYNRKHYQLTHLLEKSHVIRNQFGTYGTSTPDEHIKPVEEKLILDYMDEVRRIIEES